MKIVSGAGISDRVPILITETLERIGAKELAGYTLYGDTHDDPPRFIIVSDRGLVDVSIEYSQRARIIDMTYAVHPWHLVSAEVTITAMAGMGDKRQGGRIRLMGDDKLTLEREDGGRQGEAFDEFARALLEHWRPV
jgi:hypothetical protein